MIKAPQAKKMTTTILLFILLAAFTFSASTVTKAATNTATGEPTIGEITVSEQFQDKHWEKAFHTQLQQWIGQLSTKDTAFQTWSSAKYEFQALAPGSRLWVVTLFPQKKAADSSPPLGYLIVGEPSDPEQGQEDQPTFQLLEYGLGTPPFHSKKRGMNPVYGGLESFWQGENQVIDATSGETYPFHPTVAEDDETQTQLGSFTIRSGQQLTSIDHWNNANDPFADISWLNQSPESSLSAEQLVYTDNGERVILVARLYDGAVLAPYTVTGFHLWDTQLFVAVLDQGERYLPYEHYTQLGSFLAAGGTKKNQAEQQ